jgi:hypothetical protein
MSDVKAQAGHTAASEREREREREREEGRERGERQRQAFEPAAVRFPPKFELLTY